MPMLARENIRVVVTCDSSILRATVRRNVWRTAELSLFVLTGEWGNLKLFEQARMLIWWWPTIVIQAETGPQGGAWRVPLDLRSMATMQRMFGDPNSA